MLLWATYSQKVTGSESCCQSEYHLSSLEGSRQGTLGWWLTDAILALLCRVDPRGANALSWPRLAPVAAAFPMLQWQCSCTRDFQDRDGERKHVPLFWILAGWRHPSPATHFVKYTDCKGWNKPQHTEEAPWEKTKGIRNSWEWRALNDKTHCL